MSIPASLRFKVLTRDGFRCRYCGRDSSMSRLEVDHIVPRSSGGPDDSLNLATACAECNRGKAALHLPEAELRWMLMEIASEEGECSEHHELAYSEALDRRSVASLFCRMATAGR